MLALSPNHPPAQSQTRTVLCNRCCRHAVQKDVTEFYHCSLSFDRIIGYAKVDDGDEGEVACHAQSPDCDACYTDEYCEIWFQQATIGLDVIGFWTRYGNAEAELHIKRR
jgi:adenine-specific DNA glycosylase